MSLDTNLTSTEPTPILVLTRLKENKPDEARAIADTLLEREFPRSAINGTVYHYLRNLCYHDPDKAKTLIAHFRGHPYQWENWLPQ